jgi:hypothetical protein
MQGEPYQFASDAAMNRHFLIRLLWRHGAKKSENVIDDWDVVVGSRYILTSLW